MLKSVSGSYLQYELGELYETKSFCVIRDGVCGSQPRFVLRCNSEDYLRGGAPLRSSRGPDFCCFAVTWCDQPYSARDPDFQPGLALRHTHHPHDRPRIRDRLRLQVRMYVKSSDLRGCDFVVKFKPD